MKFKMFFIYALLLLLAVVAGCSDKLVSEKDKPSVELPSVTEKYEKIVKDAEILEAPENVSTPSEAVTKQFKVNFEDGSHLFPKKNDMIFETVLGENAITAFRSPEGENHYAVFVYTQNENWTMNGLMRFFVDESSFSDSKGLQLPMNNFNVQYLKVSEDKLNREFWAFYDENHVITVSRMDSYSFSNPSSAKEITLKNGTKAFIVSGLEQSSLFYFDVNKVIILSGNIEENEMVALANSLPSAESADFPGSETEVIKSL